MKPKNQKTIVSRLLNFFVFKSQQGFTLMELLVGLAIFSTATLIITNVFVTATRSQRQAALEQKIQSDLRSVIESLTRDIRRGIIDYDYYHGLITRDSQPVLVLRDADNNQIQYRWRQEAERGILEICTNSVCAQASDWASLVSSEVDVLKTDFYVWPDKNPYQLNEQGEYLSSQQPLVTIVIVVQPIGSQTDSNQVIKLQTSISSRVYRR